MLLNNRDALALLNEEFPPVIRSLFVPAIRRAYAESYELTIREDWLNWTVGHGLRGYLRPIAVEFEFKKLVDNGLLPFSYTIVPNKRDNCRHLELRTPRCVVTFSQVQSRQALPRPAAFRSNHSLSNQLHFEFGPLEATVKDSPFYVLLTHGYGQKDPEFVCLGLPEPDVERWIVAFDLLHEPCLTELPQTDVETVSDNERLVQFKEHVLRMVERSEISRPQ